MQSANNCYGLPDKPQIALLEHHRPENPERTEDVVNSPLSACLMTGYIASMLESHGIKVEIIDANLSGWSVKDTIEKLRNSSFKLIGVRLVYSWEKTNEIFHMMGDLRNAGVKSHINLYGHYPTFAYRGIFDRFSFIDSVTIGEPEHTFLELSRNIINNEQNGKLSSIDGLAFRNTPDNVMPRKLIDDLDLLPFPDRRNIELEKRRGVAAYILGSRGCYNNCGFCYLNPFYGDGSKWRGRSAENILEEIKLLHDQNGCASFYFADANFFGQGKSGMDRAKKIANLIIENGLQIDFGIECRANDIDENTISMLVMAGLKTVFIGIESGDQSTLNAFRKKTTVDVNKNAVNIVRKYGIEPNVGFIMFGKDIDLNGIRNNLEFLQEMGLLTDPYTTAHLFYHRQSLLHGTPDYKREMFHRNSKDKGYDISGCDDNYEALFDYKDKRVSAFADIAGSFCKTALSIISNNGDSNNINKREECKNKETNNSYPHELNRLLIVIFDQTLRLLERSSIDLNGQGITMLKKEHTEKIQKLAGSFQNNEINASTI